ncbi:iron complex outermembrane receptor protein [Pedobacter psychrotolerans]|uniref:Iron complex outermembrane receptor protein n=1 Tax=Pedobacter psychrotolerans TaxID=1843235 RepID=A0A4R2HCD1_9SPHI|nr:TonB-dependent receptor [Pedobacter psychrotolerans]TCO25379.1 iron complex outermembrane receptor protein [Pedobacter psychrotolerans]GGE45896.1 TonB-dependent receptor [Pedobacter psychrotolerans]
MFKRNYSYFLNFSTTTLLLFLLFPLHSIAQQKDSLTATLSGTVSDTDGQPLPYATISISNGKKSQTDISGKFILNNLSSRKYSISISLIGYETLKKDIVLANDSTLNVAFVLQPANSLNEVIVTAGRKAESLKDVPSSVTILNSREVKEQLNVNPSVTAILGNTVPGLGTSNNKATNAGQTLRGRQVLVLIDGIPQSTPLMNGSRDIRTLDPAVIERIEVIKGATSIYGNGSAGGIINFITKKAAADQALSGTSSMGISGNLAHPSNTLGYRFSQGFSGTLNKFSYVINGTYNYTGVQKDAKGNVIAQPDGLGENSLYNAFVKLAYKPNDHSEIVASYNLFRSVQNSDYVNVVGKYGVTPSVGEKGDDPGEAAGTPYNHNALIAYRNNALPLSNSLDLSAYYNGFVSMNRYVAQGTAWYGPGQTKIQSFKKGIRLTLNTPWKAGSLGNGELTYGLDLLNDRTNQVLTDGRVYIPDMNMLNVAPYAQMKFDILTNFILKAGIRYENATVKVKDFNTIARGPNGQGSIPVTGGKIPYRATTYNAGLRYNKYEIFNPFVSFSQGFAINELGRILRTATSSTLESIATDPIITNNYEAGFSSRLGILNVTAAYFISTSKLGANLVDVDGFLVPQREPEKIKGYEITADLNVSPQWSLGGSYSYTEGKAEQANGTKVYMNGLRIAPPKATAYLTYRPVSALDLKLFWVYTGSRDRFDVRANGLFANSEGDVKEVSLFNLSAGYRFSQKWSAGLGVENLLNSSYYPVVSQYRAIDAEYVRGIGATMSLNLNYSF